MGKGTRFLNLIIDYIGMFMLSIILVISIGIIFGQEGIAKIETLNDYISGIILMLIYYLPLESITDRTLGKLITGTKIVTEQGTKPTFKQVLGRTLARLVPFEWFSFLDKESRGWHDTWPKVYVVKSR